MSCSKRILICSMSMLNMQEKLYFHHKGQLCSSMCLHDKIEQLPPYFECAQSSIWRFHDVARARKNAPNWESANVNSPLLLINRNKGYGECCSWSILNAHRAALSGFKMKMLISMILEPKHKKLKDQNKLKQQVQIIFNIRPHVYNNGF